MPRLGLLGAQVQAAAMVAEQLPVLMNGAFFFKHDFHRNRRTRKWVALSPDGQMLRWKTAGASFVPPAFEGVGGNELTPRGETPRGTPRSGGWGSARSGSAWASGFTTLAIKDVDHIIFGAYSDTFERKSPSVRVRHSRAPLPCGTPMRHSHLPHGGGTPMRHSHLPKEEGPKEAPPRRCAHV